MVFFLLGGILGAVIGGVIGSLTGYGIVAGVVAGLGVGTTLGAVNTALNLSFFAVIGCALATAGASAAAGSFVVVAFGIGAVVTVSLAAVVSGTVGAVVATTAAIGGLIKGAHEVGQYGIAQTTHIVGHLICKLFDKVGHIMSFPLIEIARIIIDDQEVRNVILDVGETTPSGITGLASLEAKAGYQEAISRARYFIGIITVEDGPGISYENFSRQLR